MLRVSSACGRRRTPQVQWEALVGGAEASHEVVLEGSYGSFGCIDSVHSRWSFLVVNVFLFHEIC